MAVDLTSTVPVLLRMKVALLTGSLTGMRAVTTALGAAAGLAAAVGTVWLALSAPPEVRLDLLCLALAGWALGWLFGPVFLGGGEGELRPEYFAALPIGSRRLAFGLFSASLVGVGPLVTLAAHSVAVVHASTTFSVVVAVLAMPLQVIAVVLASKVLTELTSAQLTSTARAVVAALPWAVVGAFVAQFWLLLPAFSGLGGFAPSLSTVLRVLPSSWGLVAVDAAGRGEPVLAILPLAGLVALIAVLGALWSRLIARRTTELSTAGGHVVGGRWDLARLLPATRLGAVAAKELRTWVRDLDRTLYLAFAVFFALAVTLVPLLAGERGYLAATGVIVALLATAGSAQLYGNDGTALWFTLMVGGAERADVRGRQLAWLLLTAPVAIVATALGVPLSGLGWAWPWALSLLPAALGAGAGLAVLVSVFALVPRPDPKKRARGTVGGDGTGGLITWVMLPLTVLAAAPAALLPLLGWLTGSVLLSWAGVPMGVALGAGAAWWLGELAERRLRDTGTELLLAMRSGTRSRSTVSTADTASEVSMPAGKAFAAWALYLLGTVLLVVQAVVAFVLSRVGIREPTWFAALYLPDGWQVAGMVALAITGATALIGAVLLTRSHDKASRKRYHLP